MRTKLILSAMALLMACKTFAVQLTPQEALARMNTTKSQAKGFATDKSSLHLTYTSTFNGNNTYYVFNKGNEKGFIILSADDCMPAVLGVVEGNDFDYDKLPDNMKWWLSQYDVSISNYSAKGRKYVSSSTAKEDIAPLLGDIKWDQRHPYNMLCPTIEGKETPTGCVATAMAQVMGMYKWPKRGYGKNEYTKESYFDDDEDGNPEYEEFTLASDFTKSTYKWDKIFPRYYGNETEEHKLAIAQLMYDCGVAANMRYAPDGSGTDLEDAASALVRNFSYDKDIRLERQWFYEEDVWENMVYDNLSKGMPLICSGRKHDDQTSRHAYVCDGYRSDGNLFHFNWGWDGDYNGYFILTGYDPKKHENSGLYNEEQVAIFNIKPSATPYVEGSEGEFPLEVTRPYCIMKYDYNYDYDTYDSVKVDKISRDDQVTFGDESFYLQYLGYVAHDYAIGIKFKNKTDEYIISSIQKTIPAFTFFSHHSFPLESEELCQILKNGKYTVSFVYKDITAGNTEWKDAKYQQGISKPEIEVTGNEPFCKITDAAELIYNGKKVTDGIIVKVPDVNELTIKFKVMALRAVNNGRLEMNVYTVDEYTTPTPRNDYKLVDFNSAAVNTVQNITAKYSIEPLYPSCKYGIRFVQLYSGFFMPASYPGSLEFTITEPTTGIETIPQAEEKASSEIIYDIYGRKVSTTTRGGLYIKNGKKFIAK